MNRSKKIIIVSHCILNQNSVVYPLARAKGAFKISSYLVNSGAGLYQLPCPEFKHLGLTRKPMEKEDFDTPFYRSLCIKLAGEVLIDLKEYKDQGYTLCGFIGINNSPTCSISGKMGIFMEELLSLLKANNINIDYFEIPEDYNEDDDNEALLKHLKENLSLL